MVLGRLSKHNIIKKITLPPSNGRGVGGVSKDTTIAEKYIRPSLNDPIARMAGKEKRTDTNAIERHLHFQTVLRETC